MFLGAGGATGLSLYRCLAAAAEPLLLAFLERKGWFFPRRWPAFWSGWCRFRAWCGLGLFALVLVAGWAFALGYEYGVNKKLWFWGLYPRACGGTSPAGVQITPCTVYPRVCGGTTVNVACA